MSGVAVSVAAMTRIFADQQLEEFVTGLGSSFVPAAELGAQALRAASQDRARARPGGPALHVVRDVVVPGVGCPARWYLPSPRARSVLLFLHGGGWVIGDLETHDRVCRRLADRSGVAVLALDYRRAPEHPWPAAVQDVVGTVRWLAGVPGRLPAELTSDLPGGGDDGGWHVGIGGDSAGGTLAALACQRLVQEAPEALPRWQALLYANTDLSHPDVGSLREKAHGFGLDAADIRWFTAQWVPRPELLTDPLVSPAHAPSLAGLPPALVVTAEHDPLRDQGESFAERLERAGVPTILRRERGMVHNFLLWDLVSPACAAAADRVADDVARLASRR